MESTQTIIYIFCVAKISFVLLFRWEGEYLLNPLLSNPPKKKTATPPKFDIQIAKMSKNDGWDHEFPASNMPNHFWYLGVSKNRGTPKWMVYNDSKPYEQMG